jgi:hypothetical protein
MSDRLTTYRLHFMPKITNNTIHQLTNVEHNDRFCKLTATGKRIFEGQLKFEKNVLMRNWSFSLEYKYIKSTSKVKLLTPYDKYHTVSPHCFNNGSGKSLDIKMPMPQTVHKLSVKEFEDLIKQIKNPRQLKSQKKFEQNVVMREWKFSKNYQYVASNHKVELITPCGKIYPITPSHFNAGKGAKYNKKTVLPKFIYDLDENSLNQLLDEVVGSVKSSIVGQRKFEMNVVQEGWGFSDEYKYRGSGVSIGLITPDGQHISIMPLNFNAGRHKNHYCDTSHLPQFVYHLEKDEFNNLVNSVHDQKKKSLYFQKKFETTVIQREWSFPSSYIYKGANSKSELVCSKNHSCNIVPSTFLNSKNGCLKCDNQCPVQAKENFEKIIKDSNYFFGNDYLYSGARNRVSLICNLKHDYMVTPSDFVQGYRCLKCSQMMNDWRVTYFNPNVWAYRRNLYYLQFWHENHGYWWKIGLESVTRKRYTSTELERAGILMINDMSQKIELSNYDATMTEYFILKQFDANKINMMKLLNIDTKIHGGTECFDSDILEGRTLTDLLSEAKLHESELIAVLNF